MFDLPSNATNAVEAAPGAYQSELGSANADWSSMLLAICDKLTSVVANPAHVTETDPLGDAFANTRSGVLECTRALEQMHDLLRAQFGASATSCSLRHTRAERPQRATRAGPACSEPPAADQRPASRLLPNGQLGSLRARGVATSFEEDGVTWLAGEQFFLERADHMLRRSARSATPVAVLLVQIEGMQSIREQHGRVVAQQTLTNALARLINRIPTRDVTCRVGQQQFACLLTHWTSRDALDALLAGMLSAVNADYAIGELKLKLRATAGVAVTPVAGATASALLESAHAALEHAASSPSGCAFFNARMLQLAHA